MSGDEQSPPQRSVEEIQADLEHTRHELGQTVEALGERLDVKTRISTSARRLPGRVQAAVTGPDGKPKPEVLAAAGALVAVTVAVVVWRRRR